MQISRFLRPELVRLEMTTTFEENDEEEIASLSPKRLLERKKVILNECVDLLDLSGKVSNKHKLLVDLFNREKKATTAIGRGVAIPHVRSMQAKELIIGVGRSVDGYDFDSLDGTRSQVFVPMAAPPYDDNLYLKVFKTLAQIFSAEGFLERVMAAQAPYDIIRIFEDLE